MTAVYIDVYVVVNEVLAGIVSYNFKANLMGIPEHEFGGDLFLSGESLLVSKGPAPADRASCNVGNQSSLGINFQALLTGKPKGDALRIGLWVDNKIVFHLSLVPVIDEVNCWINLAVFDFAKSANIRVPMPRVIPDKIIDGARKLVEAIDYGGRIRAKQGDAELGWGEYRRGTARMVVRSSCGRQILRATGLKRQHR